MTEAAGALLDSRELDWEGCVNVRDLGGLPTDDGGRTRRGVVVRSANPRQLTDGGWASLRRHGVTLVLDLRAEEELRSDPAGDLPVRVVRVPLMGERDGEYLEELARQVEVFPDEATQYRVWYLDTLERHRAYVVNAVRAVADADDGAVLIHCVGGKDRTGLVAALLLRLAGVPIDDVCADYAASSPIGPAPREAMRDVLEEVGRRYGDAEGYLRAGGIDAARLGALRARLREAS
jgi:protein tyrosine/serine phosphatase